MTRKFLGLGDALSTSLDSDYGSSDSGGGGYDWGSILDTVTKVANTVTAVDKTVKNLNPPGTSAPAQITVTGGASAPIIAPTPPPTPSGLSTGAKIGIGVGGAAVLAAIVYAIVPKKAEIEETKRQRAQKK